MASPGVGRARLTMLAGLSLATGSICGLSWWAEHRHVQRARAASPQQHLPVNDRSTDTAARTAAPSAPFRRPARPAPARCSHGWLGTAIPSTEPATASRPDLPAELHAHKGHLAPRGTHVIIPSLIDGEASSRWIESPRLPRPPAAVVGCHCRDPTRGRPSGVCWQHPRSFGNSSY